MKHGRVGSGNKVHFIATWALCGSGKNSFGSRRMSRPRLTTDPVTCEKCMKLAESDDARAQLAESEMFYDILEARLEILRATLIVQMDRIKEYGDLYINTHDPLAGGNLSVAIAKAIHDA